MHYVKQFHINGVDTKQVACIELHGKPNAATEGYVGVLGIDVDSPLHDVYKCVAVNGSIYTWELLSSGLSFIVSDVSRQGVEKGVFPYDKLKTPSLYVVKIGDAILDAGGYLYHVESIGASSCVATDSGKRIENFGGSEAAVPDNVANALKGNASGEILALNDVSPIEHEMGVKVRSKNILPTNYFSKPGKNAGDTFTYSDEEQKLTMLVDNSKDSTGVYKRVNTSIVEIGKRYAISVDLRGTAGKAMRFGLGGSTDLVSITLTEEYTRYTAYKTITSGDEPISLFVRSTANTGGFTEGDYFQWQNMQIALDEEGATATAYAPYIEDISAVTLKVLGKNLLPFPYYDTTKTENGITFTVNSDGSITANGTATANAVFYLVRGSNIQNLVLGANRNVSFSGCPAGGSSSTYMIALQSTDYTQDKRDYGEGVSFVTTRNDYYMFIRVYSGTTVSNLTFYPQVEYDTAKTPHEPYIEPVNYPVGVDGVVQGVVAIYPNTTLTTDTAGAIIDCEYNRDANKVVNSLLERIAALEAAVL